MVRPLACVMSTFFRALRRSLFSPRRSRPKWSRNRSGARTVALLSSALRRRRFIQAQELDAPTSSYGYVEISPRRGPGADSARSSAGSLIVSGAHLVASGAGSARALRAHQSYRERSLLGRQVSLNRGRKRNRAPRSIDAPQPRPNSARLRATQSRERRTAQFSAPPIGRLA